MDSSTKFEPVSEERLARKARPRYAIITGSDEARNMARELLKLRPVAEAAKAIRQEWGKAWLYRYGHGLAAALDAYDAAMRVVESGVHYDESREDGSHCVNTKETAEDAARRFAKEAMALQGELDITMAELALLRAEHRAWAKKRSGTGWWPALGPGSLVSKAHDAVEAAYPTREVEPDPGKFWVAATDAMRHLFRGENGWSARDVMERIRLAVLAEDRARREGR